MKKLLVIGIIGLFLVVSLVPGITANIFPILNDNTINVQPGIEIKKPQPGVYIFGNKILETENIIIIIGAFTVEAGGYHGLALGVTLCKGPKEKQRQRSWRRHHCLRASSIVQANHQAENLPAEIGREI